MTVATLQPPKMASAKYISRAISILQPPGSTVELRFLGVKGRGRPYNAVGYYRDFDKAGRDVVEMETKVFEGCYFVLNQICESLYSRSPDRITEYPKATTTDADIVRRLWLLIDCDPRWPTGISSTFEELKAAEILAAIVRDWLVDREGWPEPIEAMSGNGWHLLFGLDLPNNEASKSLVENILTAAKEYAEKMHPTDMPRCIIDTSVFNASRICKLYGTLSGKGYSTEERPHRRSYLAHVPGHFGSWETD